MARSAQRKTSVPRYDDRRGWTGGDSKTLYTFTDRRTGTVGVHPGGGGAGKKLLMHWGPEVDVRVATRAEAEEHWQRPLHAGWRVLESGAHHATKKYGPKASEKVERTMHELKRGTLKSGRSGKKVTSRKQAIAIGLAQARRAGGKVPPLRGHATMDLDARVRAYLGKMRPGDEIDARGIARAIGGVDPLAADYALERAERAGLAVTSDGRWFGPAGRSAHSKMLRSPVVRVERVKMPNGTTGEIHIHHGRGGYGGVLVLASGNELPLALGVPVPTTAAEAVRGAKKFLASVYGRSN
jgi:hypothetical protein